MILHDAGAVTIVGVAVHPASTRDVVATVLGWVADGSPPRVAVGVNAHVCNLAARDRRFASLVAEADLRYADGQSIVWAARALGSALPGRVATTDLIVPLAAECAREGRRLFLFGGRPGVAESAAERLRNDHPGLRVATEHGYLAAEEMEALLAGIATHQTDVLLVGLGDPAQQEWVHEHRSRLHASAVLTCGGLFDWVSGSHRRAPRWMIGAGLEWLWRLLIEPRRLARRYLVGNPVFIARLLLQLLTRRRTPR